MTLEVRDLCVSYDGIEALRGVDLDVDTGEMVALIGSNGAGKSTLLNAISRIVRLRRGQILFEGRDITGLAAHHVARLGLLHVPEGRQILADLTVLENLQVGMLARGNRRSRYDLKDVYRLFPVLEERQNQIAGTLSGGQQQMLAIGRALMGGPEMLLLDEPSLGLSPIVTDQVFAVLEQLNRDGLTVLLVEQNAHRALSITKRAYVLERGRVALSSASAELVENEAVIASYLGMAAELLPQR